MTILSGGERVLHRLALALEVRDALTSRAGHGAGGGAPRGLAAPAAPGAVTRWRAFPAAVFGPGIRRRPARLRITDATRRVVPRRFRIAAVEPGRGGRPSDERRAAAGAVHPGPVARAPGLAVAGLGRLARARGTP